MDRSETTDRKGSGGLQEGHRFFLPSFDSSDIREDEAKQQSKKEEQAAAHPSVRAPVSVCTRGLEVKNNESP